MDTLNTLLLGFISIVVINNLVLTKFLGICPFLGVSGRIDMAFGMGLAVTFVMVLSGTLTWMIDHMILVPLGLVPGILRLYLGRIEQYDLSNLRGSGGTIYLASETVLDQLRQQTTMIQMRMSQKDSIYAPRLHRERFPVPLPELPFLVKPAINENLGAVCLKEMTRTCDILGGTKKP